VTFLAATVKCKILLKLLEFLIARYFQNIGGVTLFNVPYILIKCRSVSLVVM